MTTTHPVAHAEPAQAQGLKNRLAELVYPFLVAVVAAIFMAGLWGPADASVVASSAALKAAAPTVSSDLR